MSCRFACWDRSTISKGFLSCYSCQLLTVPGQFFLVENLVEKERAGEKKRSEGSGSGY